MANPRQRRKLRSGTHKPVQHSRRAKKLLKKQPPIRGPKVLQEAWDEHKTVRQNYEALGLVASLNPMASGGVERLLGSTTIEPSMDIDQTAQASSSSLSGPSSLRKGFGRIIRDENGNIVDVQIAEDDDETSPEPTDRLIEDIPDPSKHNGLEGWVTLGSTARTGTDTALSGTHVVQSLEEISKTRAGPAQRFTSTGEHGVLERLVAKYKDDVEAMARDRKLNVDQRTAGQLSRAITKAGGFAELMKAG